MSPDEWFAVKLALGSAIVGGIVDRIIIASKSARRRDHVQRVLSAEVGANVARLEHLLDVEEAAGNPADCSTIPERISSSYVREAFLALMPDLCLLSEEQVRAVYSFYEGGPATTTYLSDWLSYGSNIRASLFSDSIKELVHRGKRAGELLRK